MISGFAIAIILCAVLVGGNKFITVFIISGLFGASAAVSLPALGGAPLTPIVFCLPFLAWKVCRQSGISTLFTQIRWPNDAFWLTCLTVWGVLGAIFLPRLFIGDMSVYTTARSIAGTKIVLQPLAPNSTNITQSCYLVGGWLTFIIVKQTAQYCCSIINRSIIFLAALNCVAAAIGLGESYGVFPQIMTYLKNANYAIFENSSVEGYSRITGTFSEASAFASFTLPLAAYTLQLGSKGHRAALVISLVSFALLIFSTSSSAYVGVALYISMSCVFGIVQAIRQSSSPQLGILVVLGGAGLAVACIMLLLDPGAFDPALSMFDRMVLNKMNSASGIERSAWNGQATQNVIDSYLVGVGVGSARGSGFIPVLLSNVGVLGAACFIGFLGNVLFPIRSAGEILNEKHDVHLAAANAVIASLIMSSLVATVFDIGLMFYLFSALSASTREIRAVSRSSRW